MSRHARLALLVAVALGTVIGLSACQGNPTAAGSTATPDGGTPVAQATPSVPPGGIEVALAAIKWPDGPAVARVNGVDIKTDAWRDEVTRQLRLVTAQYQVDWNDQANLDHLPEIQDTIIDRMVTMELLRQLAAKEGVTVSEADVQKTAETAKQQIVAGGQYADVDAYMKDNNLTQEQFDTLIREQAVIDKMLVAHGGPTEMEQVHARHILVADEATAKEVLDKLAANESFENLAKNYSTDTGSKDQGGDLGWFPRGAMVQEFEDAAFSLQPGQTSGAVQTTFGYHVIRVEERGVRALEEPMLSQVREQAFTEWLDGQRTTANIERLYTAAPVTTPTAAPTAVPSVVP